MFIFVRILTLVLMCMVPVLSTPMDSQIIELTKYVFGTYERTPYCNNNQPVFWLKDTVVKLSENRSLIFRATTIDKSNPQFNTDVPTGYMSVYELDHGIIYVIAEYSIQSDEHGNPTQYFGIQRYTPRLIYGAQIVSAQWFESTSSYAYCADVGSACEPQHIQGSWVGYYNGWQTSGNEIWLFENHQQRDDYIGWYPHYARTHVYDGQTGHPLRALVDETTTPPFVMTRAQGVRNGICY